MVVMNRLNSQRCRSRRTDQTGDRRPTREVHRQPEVVDRQWDPGAMARVLASRRAALTAVPLVQAEVWALQRGVDPRAATPGMAWPAPLGNGLQQVPFQRHR